MKPASVSRPSGQSFKKPLCLAVRETYVQSNAFDRNNNKNRAQMTESTTKIRLESIPTKLSLRTKFENMAWVWWSEFRKQLFLAHSPLSDFFFRDCVGLGRKWSIELRTINSHIATNWNTTHNMSQRSVCPQSPASASSSSSPSSLLPSNVCPSPNNPQCCFSVYHYLKQRNAFHPKSHR